MSIALTLHILAAVVWVGGMFIVYVCLPSVAATPLEPPIRLELWHDTLKRFFPWVWSAVATLLVTGHVMIALYGGFGAIGKHVHFMMGIAYLMFLLYAYLYFAPFKKFKALVNHRNWPKAAEQLNAVRKIVAINLTLGIVTVAIASGGKYFFYS